MATSRRTGTAYLLQHDVLVCAMFAPEVAVFRMGLVSAMLMGCGPGEPGADGAPGPQGEPGPPGQDAAQPVDYGSFHWVDATGARMSNGPDLVAFDSAGIGWHIDPTTSWATAFAVAPTLYHEADDCSGDALLSTDAVPPPRIAMVLDEQHYVTPDEGVQRDVCAASVGVPGSCSQIDEGLRCTFVRRTALTPIGEPDVAPPGVPPFRPAPHGL